ncbi:unnamed protein product [Clavelina lepadiformis]|uniref:Ribosome biogenesis protein NOP53 n=1 Tax=Clavelina lepadiformis TaxID=159417 RepID=A0ABP0EY52_CLALP
MKKNKIKREVPRSHTAVTKVETKYGGIVKNKQVQNLKQFPREKQDRFTKRDKGKSSFLKSKLSAEPYQPDNDLEKAKKNRRISNRKSKRKKLLKSLQEKMAEKEMWTDHVKFGEVVLRPPDLRTKPRKTETRTKNYNSLQFMKKFGTEGNKLIMKTD